MTFADPAPRAAVVFDVPPHSDGILRRFRDTFGGLGGDNPKLALFFSSFGREPGGVRYLKHAFGATDGVTQFGAGLTAPTLISPLASFLQGGLGRSFYVPASALATFNSFDADSVLLDFSIATTTPSTPRVATLLLSGGDLETSMGLLNAPTVDTPVTIPHGLAGAPDGFIFFSTGRKMDGASRSGAAKALGFAAWDGATLTQWCHQFYVKDAVTTSAASGALHDNRVGASINVAGGATNDFTLELTQAAGVFSIVPRGGSPALNGDIFWIALRGAPCDAKIVNLPQTAASDWVVNGLPVGRPPMFGIMVSTMLDTLNTINTAGLGSTFCTTLLRESISPSFSYRCEVGETDLVNVEATESGCATDMLDFELHDNSGKAFNIDALAAKFTTTGFTVPAAAIHNVQTGPRKAGLFVMRAPNIAWLQAPAVDFAQGTGISFTAVPNCDGLVYARLLADGATAPTATQIITAALLDLANAPQHRTTYVGGRVTAPPDAVSVIQPATAYDELEGGFIGLDEGATYDLWITYKDAAQRTITPVKIDVTLAPNPDAIKTFTVARV